MLSKHWNHSTNPPSTEGRFVPIWSEEKGKYKSVIKREHSLWIDLSNWKLKHDSFHEMLGLIWAFKNLINCHTDTKLNTKWRGIKEKTAVYVDYLCFIYLLFDDFCQNDASASEAYSKLCVTVWNCQQISLSEVSDCHMEKQFQKGETQWN